MRSLLILVLGLLALGCAAAGSAAAQAVNAPPGLSGVDEYLETVPGAGGAERPGGGTAKPLDDPEVAARARTAVPARTLRALRESGEDGERAAALAASGAPSSAESPSGSRSPGGQARGPRVALPAVTAPSDSGRVATGAAS